ncbi:MAG TPA: 16S rRNA (cytidine(1402)-2'-O)-methyltransferase [Micromonosporaceae bacterium]
MSVQSSPGTLILVGAPLGNPGDVSPRVRQALATADVIAAEDTRRLARLGRDLDIAIVGRVVSYFEGNEQRRTPELTELLAGGATVAVVTDGGMPSVSDPGYRLVRAAIEVGAQITAVPGPSAVTTALAVSGLPCDRFCFEGFPPRRPGERRTRFADLATERRTMVFFEAPHRIAATLADLADAFGRQRPAALCRELTKTHEEVRRATLGELLTSVTEDEPRGEITLVVGGAVHHVTAPAEADVYAAVLSRESMGVSRRDAIVAIAREYALPKREVYDVVVRHSGGERPDARQ